MALFALNTLKKLYYTYWTFLFVFVLSLAPDVISSFKIHPNYFICYVVLIGLLIPFNYLIAAPIYYPRINWWEYDFRFRSDLKCKILDGSKVIEGRLSDFRRNQCCLYSFERFDIGALVSLNINLKTEFNVRDLELKTRRNNIPGRPFIYGIIFKKEKRSEFKTLKDYYFNKLANNKISKFSKKHINET